MPSKIPHGESRGWIVPIGGAENKENDRPILERFVRVSGGADADIVVIPTASRMHETGARYEKLFSDLGAAKVTVMEFDTRRDCQEPGLRRPRERLGRCIAALAYNPFAVGIGLDEDTAAFIGPDETIEVEGSGGVTVVDASEVSYSSIGEVGEGQPVCVLGLRLHILAAGATFNLHTRLAQAGGLVHAKE